MSRSSRSSRSKKKKKSQKPRKRDKTIEAAFRGEVNTREKIIPDRKQYSRKASKVATRQKKIKGEDNE